MACPGQPRSHILDSSSLDGRPKVSHRNYNISVYYEYHPEGEKGEPNHPTTQEGELMEAEVVRRAALQAHMMAR